MLISSNADYRTALAEEAQSKFLLLETPTKNGGKEILLYQSSETGKREGSYAVSDVTEETSKLGAALEEGVTARILLTADALCIQTAEKIYYIAGDRAALDSMDAADCAAPVEKLLRSSKGTEVQSEVLKLNLQSENNTKK